MRPGFEMRDAAQQDTNSQSNSAAPSGFRAWMRRIVRATLVLTLTLALALAWFFGLPFTWGSGTRRRRWRKRVFQVWSRTMLRICSCSLRVAGVPPRAPCFLVANHVSYVDVIVIAATLDATFVSMSELEGWPLFGTMARQFGTVFIDRSKKRDIPAVNAELERALARSDAVVIFPEGRHSRGDVVLPFRPSLLEPAARGGHAVAWAVLHYATGASDPPASRVLPWVEGTFAHQAFGLLALARIDATLTFGEDVVRGDERKLLAENLHARVAQRFTPLAR